MFLLIDNIETRHPYAKNYDFYLLVLHTLVFLHMFIDICTVRDPKKYRSWVRFHLSWLSSHSQLWFLSYTLQFFRSVFIPDELQCMCVPFPLISPLPFLLPFTEFRSPMTVQNLCLLCRCVKTTVQKRFSCLTPGTPKRRYCKRETLVSVIVFSWSP